VAGYGQEKNNKSLNQIRNMSYFAVFTLTFCGGANIVIMLFYACVSEVEMKGYVTAEAMAERWNVSVRQVQLLCQIGKIKNVSRFGNAWAIPEDTPKPTRTGELKPGRKPKE